MQKIFLLSFLLLISCVDKNKFVKCFDPKLTTEFDKLTYEKFEYHIDLKKNIVKQIEIYSDKHLEFLMKKDKNYNRSPSSLKNNLQEYKILSNYERITMVDFFKYPFSPKPYSEDKDIIIFDSKHKTVRFFDDKKSLENINSYYKELICK